MKYYSLVPVSLHTNSKSACTAAETGTILPPPTPKFSSGYYATASSSFAAGMENR